MDSIITPEAEPYSAIKRHLFSSRGQHKYGLEKGALLEEGLRSLPGRGGVEGLKGA